MELRHDDADFTKGWIVMAKQFGVVFRVGTREQFVWKRIGPFATRAQAVERAQDHTVAIVVDFNMSVAIGVPETFDMNTAITENR